MASFRIEPVTGDPAVGQGEVLQQQPPAGTGTSRTHGAWTINTADSSPLAQRLRELVASRGEFRFEIDGDVVARLAYVKGQGPWVVRGVHSEPDDRTPMR